MMNFAACVGAILLLAPCVPAPPGKSTISASDAMHSLAFNLKYFPVTVAEDNSHGDAGNMGMNVAIQGRSQVLQNNSYTARNCQLFSSTVGDATWSRSAAASYKITPNGLGKDCSYSTGGQELGTKMHMVFAYNKGQCCNACVATEGCIGASFATSSKDHSGGFGPQTWEGFGIHITDVTSSKTTGGIPVSELEGHFKTRLGDMSKFDQFMDYSVTFFTYDLQPYADAFTKDGVPFFVAQWTATQSQDTWYSLFVLVNASHYVIELTSTLKPSVGLATLPVLEPRMSDDHAAKFKPYGRHPANVLEISSINRATSNITLIDEVYSELFKATLTHHFSKDGVTRKCYNTGRSSSSDGKLVQPPGPPGVQSIDEDICFTERAADQEKDAAFSVTDFEAMLWATHASVIGSSPSNTDDKYLDNHYANPMNDAGMSAMATYFTSNDPFPLTKDTRLAYDCDQNYFIDPTGWAIQPMGMASWPHCSDQKTLVV